MPASPLRPNCRGSLSLGIAGTLILALLGGEPAVAGDYRLGPQDKVRVRVHEWRATQDQLFEWKALNEEFTVGPDGTLALPLAGQVQAAGRTPREVGKAIAEQVQARLGLSEPFDPASVDIVQFRPFYIVGQVERPGEYPYRPGLTVLQALSIGGGLLKMSDLGLLRIERESISARGELSVYALERDGLLVRRARLESERKGVEVLELSPALKAREAEPSLALVTGQEKLILQARWEAFKTQNNALEQLKTFLEKEISSLEAQIVTQDTQMKLVMKELQSVTTLVEKGLSAAPRQLNLERTVAQIQGERLRMESTLLRARQEISRANISILELRNGRMNEIVLELRKTTEKLGEVTRKADTTTRLLHEAEVTAPSLAIERGRAMRAQPVFTIVRTIGDRTEVIAATEASAVEPGDTVKVEIPRALDVMVGTSPSGHEAASHDRETEGGRREPARPREVLP